MSNSDRETLRALVHSSARSLDDRRYAHFTALFCEDGEYRVETAGPECPRPMTWMLLSRQELAERFEVAPAHEWQISSLVQQTRLVSVDLIEIGQTTANTSSSFCLFHTDEDGSSNCYALGRYEDCWHLLDNEWKLKQRTVHLKTRMLAIPSPLPI